MANEYRKCVPAPARGPRAVEDLAARLFAATYTPARGKTPEAVADECLAAARAFYRAADNQQE